jgi:hypothetical protein
VKGYMQIPGVDFTESFSPVATDATIRMIIGIFLFQLNHKGEDWILEMFDVEAAFLNAELDKPMYVEWPEGIVELGFLTQEELDKYCIQLDRAMYGNVDAPLQWMRTFSKHLKENGLTQSKVDPCLFYSKDENGSMDLLLTLFVDDTLVAGKRKRVQWLYTMIKKRFNIDILGKLKKHLGVWWTWHKDKDGNTYLEADMKKMRLDIIESFEKARPDIKLKNYSTPATPGTTLKKNEGKIIQESDYRSVVGKALYLTTKVAPELCNACRELSTHLSSPSDEHWKELGRLVGYMKHRKQDGIMYRTPSELRSISFSDSDYAKCEETRRSVSGRVNTLGGMLTNMTSKKQGSVTLSSTEAELVAGTECAQEAMFQSMLLEELLGRKVQATVFIDNTGAIFLVKNHKVGSRTKHIAVRHLYMRELQERGQVKVEFIPTAQNVSDIGTKNLAEKLFTKHANRVLDGRILECLREDVKMYEVSGRERS